MDPETRIRVHESVTRSAEHGKVGERGAHRPGPHTYRLLVMHLQRSIAADSEPDPKVLSAAFADALRKIQLPKAILRGSRPTLRRAPHAFAFGDVSHLKELVSKHSDESRRLRSVEPLPRTDAAEARANLAPPNGRQDLYICVFHPFDALVGDALNSVHVDDYAVRALADAPHQQVSNVG